MSPGSSGAESDQIAPVFVARQPILDSQRNVIAYELLFRAGADQAFPPNADPDRASAQVMLNAISVFGLDVLLGTQQAFINVTKRVLVDGLYTCMPQARVVFELLETLRPDPETLRACAQAKAAGYTLALDDFVGQPELRAFLPYVDLLKIDLRVATGTMLRALADEFRGSSFKLVAEKVETSEDFDNARQLGFSHFQGYFFCRPEIVSRKELPSSKLIYLEFLRELTRPSLDYRRLEQVIKLDVALSVKLLRYLNAASFGWRHEVKSLQQALTMLGEQPFRRWASLLAMAELSADGSRELLTTCLVRARFCELLADGAGLAGRELDLFLMGLLSLVDALVGRPLVELIDGLSLPSDISAALLDGDRHSSPGSVLRLVTAYERGRWDEVDTLAATLGLPTENELPGLYRDAVAWATSTHFAG
jgi:c-di-GMP-related signal transduction protein